MHFTFKLRDQLEGNCPSTYNKGGGGSTTVTESGIPKEFRPYITEGLKTAESMYKTEMGKGGKDLIDAYGQLGATGSKLGAEAAAEREGLNQFKTEGAGATTARDEYARQLGQDYNQMIQQDLTKTAAQGQLGMSGAGALGSARAQMAQQGALADRALQLRQAENAQRSAAVGNLAGMDAAQQQRYLSGLEAGQALGEQEYKAAQAGVTATTGAEDAPYRSLDRFFGYLSSPALGSESKQTQTGGGK
jgi:hypothetical protein